VDRLGAVPAAVSAVTVGPWVAADSGAKSPGSKFAGMTGAMKAHAPPSAVVNVVPDNPSDETVP